MATRFDSKDAGDFPTYFQVSSTSSSSANRKFTILPVEGEAKVTIAPGDVSDGFTNGIVPKIGGDFITDFPAPELSVSTGSVYIEATMDSNGSFTDCIIDNDTVVPSGTSTLRYKQIGTVSVSGVSVTVTLQSVETSLSHILCNGTSVWGTT
jgi:hypothetical protein